MHVHIYMQVCTRAHTKGHSREHSLGKAYEVLVVGVHVSQLNIDEEHDLWVHKLANT